MVHSSFENEINIAGQILRSLILYKSSSMEQILVKTEGALNNKAQYQLVMDTLVKIGYVEINELNNYFTINKSLNQSTMGQIKQLIKPQVTYFKNNYPQPLGNKEFLLLSLKNNEINVKNMGNSILELVTISNLKKDILRKKESILVYGTIYSFLDD